MRLASLFLLCASICSAQVTVTLPGPGPIQAAVSGSFTEKTPSHNFSCASGTTCSVTLSQAISNGDLVTVEGDWLNGAIPISVSAGGTLLPCYSCTQSDSSTVGSSGAGYVYPATATSGPITVTLSTAPGSTWEVVIRDFTVTGGTVAPDSFNATDNASAASPYSGSAIGTLAGTNDAIIQMTTTQTSAVTAVASPWNTNFLDNTAGDRASATGYADHINTTSTTPPSWTSTGTQAVRNHTMAFGFGNAACTDDIFIDFSGGTATNNVTQATLISSTFGADSVNSGPYGWGTASGSPASSLTFQTAAYNALLNTYRTCAGQRTGTGGTLGVKFDVSASTTYDFAYGWPTMQNSASVGFWYVPHVPTSDTSSFIAMNGIVNVAGSDFVDPMLNNGQIYIETNLNPNGAPDAGTKFSYTEDALYWITTNYQMYVTPLSITSVANASGGNTVYTGTITGGGSNGLVGKKIITYGFAQSANNSSSAGANAGIWTCQASTGTTLTLNNPSGVTDTTGSATATFHSMSIYNSSGTLLSAQAKQADSVTPDPPIAFRLGRLGDSGTVAGDYIYISNIKIRQSGSFPVLP